MKAISLLYFGSLAYALTTQCGVDATYEYVVVGGGTAGSTVATRLAEAGHSVMILEAGGMYETDLPLEELPGEWSAPSGTDPTLNGIDLNVDWGFVTVPQAGANHRRLHYARGKCLGGSSAINSLVYQRGTKGSYQQWADQVGDTSYEWDEILPYFEKTFQFTPPDTSRRLANATTSYNPDVFAENYTSPVHVSYLNGVSAFSTWVKEGLDAAGVKETEDFNSGVLNGAQYSTATADPETQLRSSADMLVANVVGNTSLAVCTHTLAQRVLFDESKNAVGVKADYNNGTEFTVTASKEVIVSAGAFQSPQMLMVSGIGPAEILHEYEIPVLADRPGVGQNMWDHVLFGIDHPVNMDTITRFSTDPQYADNQMLEFMANKTGVLAGAADLLAWEKVPAAYRSTFSNSTLNDLGRFPSDWPEIEYISGNFFLSNWSSISKQQPTDGRQYAVIMAGLVAPTSRGNVSITSASTKDLPIVNPNWLTTKTDQEVALAAFKRLRAVWQTGPMQNIITGPEYYPGSEVQSDEEILNVIRNSISPIWHPSGTCKMGRKNDTMAVVDSEARVYGVNRLRVVDTSAFPFLPPGHPQSTVYMLAEKIAAGIIDSIKE